MSLIHALDNLSRHRSLVELGRSLAAQPACELAPEEWSKQAADAEPSYSLSGMLYVSSSGWLLLSVPNSLTKGIFSALDETGIELPTSDSEDPAAKHDAHISVMSKSELDSIGGPEVISERGKHFHYSLGRLVSFKPSGWKNMERCWALQAFSSELMELRRSYGLSSLPNNGEYPFHITCGVKRRGVTARNEDRKDPHSAPAAD